MQRDGKTLKTLKPGDRRRLSDARNAWRKMTREQRQEFVAWMLEEQEITGRRASSLLELIR